MKRETRFWRRIKPAFGKGVTRFETRESEGIPDVYYNLGGDNVTGWIELKTYDAACDTECDVPSRDGKVALRFTPAQRQFMRRHVKQGGFAFALVYVENWDTWYLLRGDSPLLAFSVVTLDQLYSECCMFGGVRSAELICSAIRAQHENRKSFRKKAG